MPFFLLFVGIMFLVASIRGRQEDLLLLLKDDFTGSGNFILWILAIVVIVLMGSFQKIKPISDAFLGLVILVIIVANYGRGQDLFSSFLSQIKEGTK